VSVVQVVELAEWEQREVGLDPEEERRLRLVAGSRLSTAPGAPGRFVLRATSHVGAFATSATHVIVHPKVDSVSVLYMAGVGESLFDLDDTDVTFARTPNLPVGLAMLYLAELERVARRGPTRSYVERVERLSALRGRVDMAARARAGGLTVPVDCKFDDFNLDTRLNRRIRAAGMRITRLPGVTPHASLRIRRLLTILGDVGELRMGDLAGPTHFTRLDEHCRTIDGLAALILLGASLDTRGGPVSAATFTLDMNKVFEKFVAVRLKSMLRGRVGVHAQRTKNFDRGGTVKIAPDLLFGPGPRHPLYVGDTKYKLAKDAVGRHTDYYQVLAYASALNLPEGVLIYCHNDGEPLSREITVGAIGVRLATYSLSLRGTITDVDQQMRELAEFIADRAGLAAVQL
jgi:5-methylcytosine-specific restriction enzyme subunit McrC